MELEKLHLKRSTAWKIWTFKGQWEAADIVIQRIQNRVGADYV